MTDNIFYAKCPFTKDGFCNPDCMLILVSSDTVEGPVDSGVAQCSFAVLASHVASEEHYGGNYLMRCFDFDLNDSKNRKD